MNRQILVAVIVPQVQAFAAYHDARSFSVQRFLVEKRVDMVCGIPALILGSGSRRVNRVSHVISPVSGISARRGRCLLAKLEPGRFEAGEFVKGVQRQVAAKARLLDTAKWSDFGRDQTRIMTDNAVLKTFGNAP